MESEIVTPPSIQEPKSRNPWKWIGILALVLAIASVTGLVAVQKQFNELQASVSSAIVQEQGTNQTQITNAESLYNAPADLQALLRTVRFTPFSGHGLCGLCRGVVAA
jgi:hypothetical protein